MADESELSRNRRYIVWDTEKASLNKLQTYIHTCPSQSHYLHRTRWCLFSPPNVFESKDPSVWAVQDLKHFWERLELLNYRSVFMFMISYKSTSKSSDVRAVSKSVTLSAQQIHTNCMWWIVCDPLHFSYLGTACFLNSAAVKRDCALRVGPTWRQERASLPLESALAEK
jgi:hypothetical protein